VDLAACLAGAKAAAEAMRVAMTADFILTGFKIEIVRESVVAKDPDRLDLFPLASTLCERTILLREFRAKCADIALKNMKKLKGTT
jgi:hypothetical protein